jgi:hypothetical protein
MTDFNSWDHSVLARFAQECSEQNAILRNDLKILLAQYRELVLESARLKDARKPSERSSSP